MTDVNLFHVADGGEVEIKDGLMTMTDGYGPAVYLSWFGGNEQDSGEDGDNAKQWWGNLSESNKARHYRSETQSLLRSLPAVPANLKRLEEAMESDVAWMLDEGVATLIVASVRLIALNRIKMEAKIDIDGVTQTFAVERHWSSQ